MPLLHTPTGDISYKEEGGKLTHLNWGGAFKDDVGQTKMTSELQAYFKGELTSFSVECTPKGTIFQKKVWQYLLTTPYGALRTYKDVAKAVGSHPRAVGGAIGKNPIPIIIPCHRVIATNGKMCGFSGGKGIETKEILLELEKKNK
jgi:methylated-DNA-[protein]-cysteine S-methyltransferase